ncbi:MAG: CDP-glycerol glycerophosphotransferase family protein [Clostridia bacterium]|nr:CDP-glycerol glycerophosphotransferase family protein [Clostridia bacterium]
MTEIKVILLFIAKIVMNLIYSLLKLFPTHSNKITMLSRQSNYINFDFQLLLEELQLRNQKLEIKVLCKKIPKQFIGRIGYCFYLLKCMYHIATSSICVIDGYSIPISVLKHKKRLKIIQIWHSMGAIKKFGYQTLDKKSGTKRKIATIMKMHQNYTAVLCTSHATKKLYAKGFGIDENKILVLGMPRIDYILGKEEKINQKVAELYQEKPELKEKKVILYVPTFRKKQEIPVENLTKLVDEQKYQLIIRLHPLDKTKVEQKYFIDLKWNTMDLIKMADYVITDYSAVAFEAALLQKKLFFYLYDATNYNQETGLNIHLKEEMPSSTFETAEEIISHIISDDYSMQEIVNFQKKYVETNDIENTKRIVDYILKLLEE